MAAAPVSQTSVKPAPAVKTPATPAPAKAKATPAAPAKPAAPGTKAPVSTKAPTGTKAPVKPAAPGAPTGTKAPVDANGAATPGGVAADKAGATKPGANGIVAGGCIPPRHVPAPGTPPPGTGAPGAPNQKPTAEQLMKDAQAHMKQSQDLGTASKASHAKSLEEATASKASLASSVKEREASVKDLGGAMDFLKKGDFAGALKSLESAGKNWDASAANAKKSEQQLASSKQNELRSQAEQKASDLYKRMAEDELRQAMDLINNPPPPAAPGTPPLHPDMPVMKDLPSARPVQSIDRLMAPRLPPQLLQAAAVA